MQPSLSRIELNLLVEGKGYAKAEIFRHRAPATVSALSRIMPLQARVQQFSDLFLYMTTGLTLGVEKRQRSFKKGDISFMVSSGSICVFLKDGDVATSMNPLGRLTEGFEVFASVRAGEVVTIAPSGKR